jgi:CBS domain-containing protein
LFRSEERTMWGNDRDRPDDPDTPARETRRLARDEYDRPRYGSAPPAADVRRAENPWGPRVEFSHERHPGGPEPAGRWDSFAQGQAPGRYPAVAERPRPDTRETHRREQPDIDGIRVHELMTRRVSTVHPASSVERAARLMEDCDCGALPVVGDNGVLVGVVTDRDIAIRVVARGRDVRNAIVADCMSERVFACYADESVAECMRQMARHRVRRMPVVDDRGRLVGIVSQSDLARHASHRPVTRERDAMIDVVGAVSEPHSYR